MELRFAIFGRTRFLVGAEFDDTWGSTKLRGILAVLLLHPGQSIAFETMIDWVWPEDQGPERDATFHTYANRIRAALNQMTEPPTLRARERSYQLDVDRREVDYFGFRRVVDEADAQAAGGDHESVVTRMTAALQTWSGPPLADAKGDRARNWRNATEGTLLIHSLETLMRSLSALGRHDEVLRRWTDLTVEQQSNLTLVKRRLEALHGSGLHSERITFHLEARKRLMDDFNRDEADELTRFHDELVRDRPGPPLPRAPSQQPKQTATPVSAPSLLPHDLRDFAGRTDLLEHFDAVMTGVGGEPRSGIMMLAGAPGIGKTSLVVHWAYRVAERFPGGVFYSDLHGFSDTRAVSPADVVNGFLAAFGSPVDRRSDATGRAAKLRSLLAERRALIVLDNAANADDVLPLLDCLTNCFVVVTSRRGLSRVMRRGALPVRVEPLLHQESVLWLTRYLGQRASQEPDAVARLAALCAGTPLALRSVADHVSARPGIDLAEFVEELRHTGNLLSLGDDGDGSESSIRTVFSWSYSALTAEARQTFRLLGVHPGPDVSLEAAAALSKRDVGSARRLLDTLVHANLLTQPHSRNRFQFHDLIRRYAREQAAVDGNAEERDAAEIRLLDFFLYTAIAADQTVFPSRPDHPVGWPAAGVVPLRFDSDEQAMAWCARERSNLLALISYADRHRLHDYALRLPTTSGEILQRLGHYDDVLISLNMAIKAAQALGDVEGEADTISNLGFVHILLRDFVSAESCVRAADQLYTRIDNTVGCAMVSHYLARIRVEQGRFGEGVALNLAALAKLRGQDAEGLEIIVLYRLGQAMRRARDLDAATTYCRDGLWLAEKVGDDRGRGLCLTELGAICLDSRDLALAKGYCARALPVHERLHDHEQAGKTYNLLAVIHRDEGHLAEAERCARRATVSCRQVRDSMGEMSAFDVLGQVFSRRGMPDEARDAWARALTIAEHLNDPLAATLRERLNDPSAIARDAPTDRLPPPPHVGAPPHE